MYDKYDKVLLFSKVAIAIMSTLAVIILAFIGVDIPDLLKVIVAAAIGCLYADKGYDYRKKKEEE